METRFDSQTVLIDGLLSQLLKIDSVVNDAKALSYYDRALQAIQKAEELGKMQDLLTPTRWTVDSLAKEGGQLLEDGPAQHSNGGAASGII